MFAIATDSRFSTQVSIYDWRVSIRISIGRKILGLPYGKVLATTGDHWAQEKQSNIVDKEFHNKLKIKQIVATRIATGAHHTPMGSLDTCHQIES